MYPFAALQRLLHVHTWQTSSEIVYSPAHGHDVDVERSVCDCKGLRIRASVDGHTWRESGVLDTPEDINDFIARLTTADDAKETAAAYIERSRKLQDEGQRYRLYVTSRNEEHEHVRFESIVTIVMSLIDGPGDDPLWLRVVLDAAEYMAQQLDIVETLERTGVHRVLGPAMFEAICEAAKTTAKTHHLAPHDAPRPRRFHWHDYQLVKTRQMQDADGADLQVQLKRCECGVKREVVRKSMPLLGSRVVAIRRIA